jgi:hypothetical protein
MGTRNVQKLIYAKNLLLAKIWIGLELLRKWGKLAGFCVLGLKGEA